MKATNLWIRTSPFLLALLLGLVSWNANPVSSQPQGEGGTNWGLVAGLIVVGAIVLAAGGGLVVRSRVRRGKESSQS